MRLFYLLTILLISGCSREMASDLPKPPPSPVLVAEVTRADVPIYLDTIGTLNAAEKVEIRPQLKAQLRAINTQEGAIVEEGQLLFTLDETLFQSHLDEANAALEKQKVALEFAQNAYDNAKMLVKDELISAQEFKSYREKLLLEAAETKAREARVRATELDVRSCLIKSPIQGRVGTIQLTRGTLVSPQDAKPMVEVQSLDTLLVSFTVAEKWMQELLVGWRTGELKAEVSLASGSSAPINADITFVDHQADPASSTVLIRAAINGAEGLLSPGQFVKVKLRIKTLHDTQTIPSTSIRKNTDGPYVFVLKEDSTVELRPISPGPKVGDFTVVLEGVEIGEQVVTEGHIHLKPGAGVYTKETP